MISKLSDRHQTIQSSLGLNRPIAIKRFVLHVLSKSTSLSIKLTNTENRNLYNTIPKRDLRKPASVKRAL
ncbi:MAG: hypothetical protein ACRC13_07360 [Tannerellaceae bacterium]